MLCEQVLIEKGIYMASGKINLVLHCATVLQKCIAAVYFVLKMYVVGFGSLVLSFFRSFCLTDNEATN